MHTTVHCKCLHFNCKMSLYFYLLNHIKLKNNDFFYFPPMGAGLVKKSFPTKNGPRTAGRCGDGAGLVDFLTNKGVEKATGCFVENEFRIPNPALKFGFADPATLSASLSSMKSSYSVL